MQRGWLLTLAVLVPLGTHAPSEEQAPGAPGLKPTWTNGNKEGVGTSSTLTSKVWFTIGNGALNEVYYPTVDKANTRSLELIVAGAGFAEIESRDTEQKVEVPDPAALVFRQVNTSKSRRYRITKTYITDPDRDTVLIHVRFEPLLGGAMRLYVFYDPSINNSGMHDTGYSRDGALLSADGPVASALVASPPFVRTSSGYFGVSDGWTEIQKEFRLEHTYARADNGNVAQVGELPAPAGQFTLALGFGSTVDAALEAASQSLRKGFDQALAEYCRGWRGYVDKLRKVDARYRDEYQMAAMVLRAHEDKTYRGAGVASLSIPWGDHVDASEPSVGGYHLVWARDLYEIATAFLAVGDKESAGRALDYLFNVQQKPDGSFPQNSWLDGRPYWKSLQLDEVSFPMILAYQFGRTDAGTYSRHIKPAATFLVKRGPSTPQERWEEQSGYSPSTIAAEIAGLVCAAEIARDNNDTKSATEWLAVADEWNRRLDSWTVTTTGPLADRYFIRIAPKGMPNLALKVNLGNGSGFWDQREIVDAGFLELVRLGVRPAGDPLIRKTLAVVDKTIRVKTPNGPGWYRYNHDGYGEKAGGQGWDGTGIGRLWVLLAGERGEYALAAGGDARPYLETMERMANQGRMLAEQVWDRSVSPKPWLKFGQGTGSATPLAWSMAQFIRLVRCIEEHRVVERPEVVVARYAEKKVEKR